MLYTSREKGDVTGKGLGQLACSAMVKWFRFFPPREGDIQYGGGGEGRMKGEVL